MKIKGGMMIENNPRQRKITQNMEGSGRGALCACRISYRLN